MPYLLVSDFKAGLDVRRSQVASVSGVLFEAKNVHISRGGEVEKRHAFVPLHSLPASTKGLAATFQGVVTFGVGPRPPELNAGVGYQNLALTPGSVIPSLNRILGWDVFGGKLYVTALYGDGQIAHFYDGVRVSDWTPPVNIFTPMGTTPRYQPVLTLSNKVYAGASNFVFFCAIDDPTKWQVSVPNLGQGFIDQSNVHGGAERVVGYSTYQGRLAVFSRRSIQIWQVDPDPAKYQLRQVLNNIGTNSARSVLSFGDTDVFFLSSRGVRSLRARDSSNSASENDIGTPIDALIQAEVQNLSATTSAYAPAIIEPSSGRYWLALGRRIYVFSYFASSRISAWSRYELSFSPEYFVTVDTNLFVRGDDDVLYIYGGPSGQEFGDDYECVVELAMPDAGKPATEKLLTGLDVACEGQWRVNLGTDPSQPDTRELVATVERTTYGMERLALQGYGTHFSYEFRHMAPGRAALFSLVTHFQGGEQD